LPGVEYHGIVPNSDLLRALRSIDVLTYPSIFAEMSCLSAIEAMAAGCRLICPSHGALPETTGQFARLYPFQPDLAEHAKLFADLLAEEIRNPWGGNRELAEQQQNYTRETYDWSVRVAEWQAFINMACKSEIIPIDTTSCLQSKEQKWSNHKGVGSNEHDDYRKDAQVLGRAVLADFLARNHRQAGESEKALENFVKRAELGYWADEIFVTLYRAAQLQEAMGRPFDEVLAAYLRASDAVPSRAEALYAASRVCRLSNKFAEGYEFASRGLKIPLPIDGLFVQTWIYDYALLDELAICASWIGRHQESLVACQRLLREGKLPQDNHDRVKKNAEFAMERLTSGASEAAARGEASARESRSDGLPRLSENGPARGPMKLLLICGPWGSGTSMVAGLFERMGALGLGPYINTSDRRTPISYESMPFMETLRPYISTPTLSLIPCEPGGLQSALRSLRQRIEQQEFGPYDPRSPKPIFLKNPRSALVIPQICEVFDTKLIYVMRPLADIERTRLRRSWLPYFGAGGAAVIYQHMSAALAHRAYRALILDYQDLLASPTDHARNIARFAELEPSAAELSQAVDFIATRRS
jgi:tetratricopeptide (TPR) repeat protein